MIPHKLASAVYGRRCTWRACVVCGLKFRPTDLVENKPGLGNCHAYCAHLEPDR